MSCRFGRARLFVGIGAATVLIALIVGAFALVMYTLSGDAAIATMRDIDSTSGRIAFVSERDGDADIYAMNADGSGLAQLTDNDSRDRDPAWSPDGSRIVFTSDRDNDAYSYNIYVMNADGSDVVQLTDDCSSSSPAWSPDGDRIAFDSLGGIYVMDTDGSDVVQLTGSPPDSCAETFLAVLGGVAGVYRRNADGSVELVTDHDSVDWGFKDGGAAWSPDGGRIAFSSGRDGDGLDELRVYVMNADGSGIERLTYEGHFNFLPSWSPDGGRIAFASGGLDFIDDMEIYVMNADGTGVERLTENEYRDESPAWSPDGGRIAFDSDRDGGGIFVMNADGSGVVRLRQGHSPAWSPLLE